VESQQTVRGSKPRHGVISTQGCVSAPHRMKHSDDAFFLSSGEHLSKHRAPHGAVASPAMTAALIALSEHILAIFLTFCLCGHDGGDGCGGGGAGV
jgi:hypothetical protein